MLFWGCGKLRGWFAPEGKLPPKAPCVTLTWTATDSTVAGYNVYRSSGSDKPASLTSSAFYGTQFMDPAVESGQTYTYYVTAVSYKGTESRPSEKITVSVPAVVVPPPAAK